MARPRTNDATVRQAILDATVRILAHSRPSDTSVRQIAADAGSSVAAIYSLFGDKDGLLDEVRAIAVEGFYQRLASVAETSDPLADIHALAAAYIGWAQQSPHLFGILFSGIGEFDPTGEVGERDPAGVLLTAVGRAQGAGLLDGPPPAIAISLWVAIHGIATLARQGAIGEATVRLALQAATSAILRGWTPPHTDTDWTAAAQA